MKFLTILTATAIAFATPVFAKDITLSTAIEGQTLHGQGVDMSVYFTDVPAGYEVVATYVTKSNAQPTRLEMLMTAGDAVKFSLPGQPRYSYNFVAAADGITVTLIDNMTLLASK